MWTEKLPNQFSDENDIAYKQKKFMKQSNSTTSEDSMIRDS